MAAEEVDTGQDGETLGDYVDLPALVRILTREGKPVRLVKPEYFIRLYRQTSDPLPCRQDLPEDAFLDVDALNKDELAELTIISISYCWLSTEHPDPRRYHLEMLAILLEVFVTSSLDNAKKEYMIGRHLWNSESLPALGFDVGGKFRPVGVFLDWTALYQDRARTVEQEELFREALKEINTWYAHKETIVWIFSSIPEDSKRASYDRSGWTSFERAVASVIKPGPRLLKMDHAARFTLHEIHARSGHYLDAVFAFMDTTRSAPLVPEAFNEFIDGKTFTNGADCDTVVKPKYAKTFSAIVRNSDALSLANTGMSGVEAKKAARVAAERSRCLRRVILAGNGQMELYLGDLVAALDVRPASWWQRWTSGGPRPTVELTELNLQGCTHIGGDFSALAPLRGLRELNLQHCCSIEGHLSALSCFTELRHLSIGATSDHDGIGIGNFCEDVTGKLVALAPLTKLMHLSIDESKIEGHLSDLDSLVELSHLSLKGRVGGQLSSLAPLAKLRHLALVRCSDVQGQLSALAPLGALRHLELDSCEGIQGQFSDLARFVVLEHLDLSGCTGVQGRLSALARLRGLQHLDVRSCHDVQGQLSDLSPLMALRRLYLGGYEGVQGQLSALAGLTALQHLDLYACQVQGQLSDLAPLTALMHLNLGDSQVQGRLFDLALLTQLRNLYLECCEGIQLVEGDRKLLESRGCLLVLPWSSREPSDGKES